MENKDNDFQLDNQVQPIFFHLRLNFYIFQLSDNHTKYTQKFTVSSNVH